MPVQTKTERLTELLQRTINELPDPKRWQSFLDTSARLYNIGTVIVKDAHVKLRMVIYGQKL